MLANIAFTKFRSSESYRFVLFQNPQKYIVFVVGDVEAGAVAIFLNYFRDANKRLWVDGYFFFSGVAI